MYETTMDGLEKLIQNDDIEFLKEKLSGNLFTFFTFSFPFKSEFHLKKSILKDLLNNNEDAKKLAEASGIISHISDNINTSIGFHCLLLAMKYESQKCFLYFLNSNYTFQPLWDQYHDTVFHTRLIICLLLSTPHEDFLSSGITAIKKLDKTNKKLNRQSKIDINFYDFIDESLSKKDNVIFNKLKILISKLLNNDYEMKPNGFLYRLTRINEEKFQDAVKNKNQEERDKAIEISKFFIETIPPQKILEFERLNVEEKKAMTENSIDLTNVNDQPPPLINLVKEEPRLPTTRKRMRK